MGVGNLNVSCSADTKGANTNINGMRVGIRGMGADARGAVSGFTALESQVNRAGASFAEFQAKFGKPLPTPPRVTGSDVDLSDQVRRWDQLNAEMRKTPGLLGTIRGSMKQFQQIAKAASIAFLAPEIFKRGFEFGQKLGNAIFVKGWKQSLADAKQGLMDLLDPGLAETRAKKLAAAQRGAEARAEKKREEEDRRKERDARFGGDFAAAERRQFAAENGEDAAQFRDDKREFGGARALALQNQRVNAANAETQAAAAKRKEEERIAALHEQRRKYEEQQRARQEAAQKKHRDDWEFVKKLREDVSTIGVGDEEREARARRAQIAGIRDYRLRQAAEAADFQLQAAALNERRDSDEAARKGRQLNPLDARSAEGFAALRANLNGGPQKMLLDSNTRQEALAETANGHLAKLADGRIVEVVKI